MIDTSALELQVAALPEKLRARLASQRGGLPRLLQWAGELGHDRDSRDRLRQVDPPDEDDMRDLGSLSDGERARLTALGEAALARGEVALLVLAGGMATRMGSVVKALVEAIPGRSFLDLRLAEQARLTATYGRPFPLWLMTSDATDGAIREAIAARHPDGDKIPGVAIFPQCVSLRLTPEGKLFEAADGSASIYPTGHGDVPEVLANSGLLASFRAAGGKIVWITNLDNLGATVDPLLVGIHLDHGKPLSCEVVEKAGDKGGIPVRHGDRCVICEDFRLPRDFDPATVRVFNTNTFLANADALADYDFPFTYVEVEKTVDGRKAIQRERLLGEITFHLDTVYIRVPRTGLSSRFLPVKSPEELAARRDEIIQITAARGLHDA
jgi:UTP--glucose-1-phosphate uridylyltransferase